MRTPRWRAQASRGRGLSINSISNLSAKYTAKRTPHAARIGASKIRTGDQRVGSSGPILSKSGDRFRSPFTLRQTRLTVSLPST